MEMNILLKLSHNLKGGYYYGDKRNRKTFNIYIWRECI